MSAPAHIFKCKHCHTPLGVTFGNRFMIGGMKVGEPGRNVTVECPKCGDAACWRPDRNVGQTGDLVPQGQVVKV